MTNLEWTINNLINQAEPYKDVVGDINNPCLDNAVALNNAIELLETLRPRVLALEELTDRMTGWLEYMHEVIPVIGGSSVIGAHCFIDSLDRSLALKDADYNVYWRIWTHEPSTEQRETIKMYE